MATAAPPLAVERILIVHVSRIGDTLLATPAIRAIAAAYPHAQITVCGHPKRVEILDRIPYIHRVAGISKQRAPWLGWLGRKRYDLAFVYGFDRVLVAYALRVAERVVAFKQGVASLDSRLWRAVEPRPAYSEHAATLLMHLPAAAGIAPAGLRLSYQVTAAETAWAQDKLRAAGRAHDRPLIGMQVASFPTKRYRDWPIEHFAALAQRLRQKWPQAGFVIFGGKEEQKRAVWLAEQLGNSAALFAGQLSLRQTAALMTQIDLYVGVDTGPTHIMSAFDIPLVGLYHCRSPSRLFGPLQHPCFFPVDHPAADAGDDHAAMADISVATVFAALEQALAGYDSVSKTGR